ncbi:ATP-dependent helicase [Streptomyces niveus]|uniref:ATP-dependent helicase n=1 Tax=Streptomyces niveus TaxID=193462 RepID=UPI00367DE939
MDLITPAPPEPRLPATLAQEIAGLHPEQREAAQHQGNLVVRAGPGAGKTRTLVARVGYLLATLSRHRSVAAITFTDATATEVSRRLRRLGVSSGRRVTSATIHSFCLQHILRPYARLTDTPFPQDLSVCDTTQSNAWWDEAALAAGLGELRSRDRTELGKQRRQLAAGYSPETFNPLYRNAIRRYQDLLEEHDVLDFDAMPERSLAILRTHPEVRSMLAARFAHLVIDEYQDLGPVLHALVLELLAAGVQVTAVGDPDQTMFGFLGADSRYLDHLEQQDGFTTLSLSVNWRSGSTLIAAGLRVLGTPRPYSADPAREATGILTRVDTDGDLDDHAARAVAVVQQRIAAGTPAEEIALLYPSEGPILSELTTALNLSQLPYDAERARKIPSGPLAEFISDVTARRLAGPLPGPNGRFPGSSRARPVMSLASTWHRRRIDAGLAIEEDTPRQLAHTLTTLLDAPSIPPAHEPAGPFLEELATVLDLGTLAAAAEDERDRTAVNELRREAEHLTLAELAGGRAPGRVVLTTYHSSKGREFDVVVLPGLVNGHFPYYRDESELRAQRRNFYVAVTRARHEVVLITGSFFTDRFGNPRYSSPSTFVDDIMRTVHE